MATFVERLQAFNQNREADLVQIKYRAMRKDVFAFFRGTCHIFYEDWSHETQLSLLNDAPPVWICGDLHWQNLGSYKGDNRLAYFNINDYDEAAMAPFTWDFARLLTSFFVSAHLLNIKESHLPLLCTAFLEEYRKELEKKRVRSIEEDKTRGIIRDLIFQTRTRSQKVFLDHHTTLESDTRKLRIDGVSTTAVTEAERAAVTELIESWGARQPNPEFYRVLDVAHRIAGIGSLGDRRYVILVSGKGSPDRNDLLDLKAAEPSSLQPYLRSRQPYWSNDAERIVQIQHKVQGVAPALLASAQLNERWHVIRELQPNEDKINSELLQNKEVRLQKLMGTLAQILAWDHLRSSGWLDSATASNLLNYVHSTRWQKDLIDYSRSYGEQVATDYTEFCTAYDDGALTPSAP